MLRLALLLSLSMRPRLVVWKTNNLIPQAVAASKTWPTATIVFTDEMCAALARRWRCRGYFRDIIMNITRADLCRYMAAHHNGGIYTDLDVSYKKPFDDSCNDLCVGYETSRSFSNYFCGRKGSPCLAHVIRNACERVLHTNMDFKATPGIIHRIAGPTALTQLSRGCAEKNTAWSMT